jgi:protein-disulfide isomerase
VLGQLLTEYRGQIRLAYKDFPLARHAGAAPAALAARCAGAQGAYWEYHDLLFLAQPAFSRDDLVGYAARLRLDTQAFAACLDSGRFRAAVEADMTEGRAAGVRGTPTFFINDRMLGEGGLYPIETFREAIESVLRARGQRRP